MKRLANKTNIDAPSGAYPYGKSKDDTGAGDGTPINFERLNDWDQLVERVFALSGITANGQPDNATDGFQLYEAFKKHFRPYKQTVIRITQTGTNAPVLAATLLDEIGLNITNADITRLGAGGYNIQFPQQVLAKLDVRGGELYGNTTGFFGISFQNTSGIAPKTYIELITRNISGVAVDGMLTAYTITITLFD